MKKEIIAMNKEIEYTEIMSEPKNWLTTGQAAGMLKLAPGTLQNWRSKGIGPEFLKRGNNVFYPKSALIEYLEQYSSLYKSTAEWRERRKD